jgi:hypothetical protein
VKTDITARRREEYKEKRNKAAEQRKLEATEKKRKES